MNESMHERLCWRRSDIEGWYIGADPRTGSRVASIHLQSGISSESPWYWSIYTAVDPRLRAGRAETKQDAADRATEAWHSVSTLVGDALSTDFAAIG